MDRLELLGSIQLHVAQLVDPTHQIAISVGIAPTLTAAHGNAHDVAGFDFLHCRQSCHLTIVDHFERHISCDFLCYTAENVNHLLFVDIRWHIWEDVTPSSLIRTGHGASRTPPNCINLWKSLLAQFHGCNDSIEVILWINVGDIPLSFL